jgi:hypothetical protein
MVAISIAERDCALVRTILRTLSPAAVTAEPVPLAPALPLSAAWDSR